MERALDRTSGDLAVVAHGHLIQYMTLALTHQDLSGSAGNLELINGGFVTFHLILGDGWTWTKIASDALSVDR